MPRKGVKPVKQDAGGKRWIGSTSAQAYTEYVVILVVLLGLGFGTASILTGFDAIQDIFYGYYSSLANYLNLPFF